MEICIFLMAFGIYRMILKRLYYCLDFFDFFYWFLSFLFVKFDLIFLKSIINKQFIILDYVHKT